MNYTELVAAIQDYTEYRETTFVANIPNFVRQAEERIYRAILIPELRKNSTTSIAAATKYVPRPSDFLAPFSLAVVNSSGEYSYLLDRDVSFIREAYPNPATQGTPRYYAQFDGDGDVSSTGTFILGPSADADYTLELHYYFDPPSIVSEGTSWLGENAETALLYGSLIEAYTYMKGDADVMAQYEKQYASAMQNLSRLARRTVEDTYS